MRHIKYKFHHALYKRGNAIGKKAIPAAALSKTLWIRLSKRIFHNFGLEMRVRFSMWLEFGGMRTLCAYEKSKPRKRHMLQLLHTAAT